MEYKNLLSPIKIGNLNLKNRVMLLAMGKSLSNEDNTVSDRDIAFLETLAKNDVGLIIPTAMAIDGDYPSKGAFMMAIYDDRFIPGLQRMTKAVHDAGAKIAFQLWHPGLSPYGCRPDEVKAPQDWTIAEIKELQRKYAQGALRAKKAGADAVEFHIAHNYLPENFLVPLFNKRTDEYGADTTENGLRFSLEAIAQIREVCGEDYPVIVKINADDFTPGGMTLERLLEAGPMLEKAGVCMITVSAGGGLTDITGMSDDGKRPEGWKVHYAEALKKVVSIPVGASGSIRHPDYAEGILEAGKCDMIGIGRGLVAEPEWVTKIQENRTNEMRHCISCMACMGYFPPGVSGCTVNPLSIREFENIKLEKNGNNRVVAVIGAGPAGLEAAVTLAQRGFKPIVLEGSSAIGGMERVGLNPPGKQKLEWQLDYYRRMLDNLNIEVRLNTKGTVDVIKSLNPYAVIVATGSNPIVPKSIPGISLPHVITAIDALDNHINITGENIVIVGAGLVGVEIAHTYQTKGNKTTVIDMAEIHPEAASGAIDYALANGYALGSGVNILMGHKLIQITPEYVEAENITTGEKVQIPANVVVLSMGYSSNTSPYEELKGEFDKVYNIGDSQKVGKIRNAVQAGFDTAVLV